MSMPSPHVSSNVQRQLDHQAHPIGPLQAGGLVVSGHDELPLDHEAEPLEQVQVRARGQHPDPRVHVPCITNGELPLDQGLDALRSVPQEQRQKTFESVIDRLEAMGSSPEELEAVTNTR